MKRVLAILFLLAAFGITSAQINTSAPGGPPYAASTGGVNPPAGTIDNVQTNSCTGTAISNGVLTTCTSISLAPGNYLVWGVVLTTNVSGASMTTANVGTNTSSGSINPLSQTFINVAFTASTQQSLSTIPMVYNLTSTTTMFLLFSYATSGGTPTVNGNLFALRLS